MTYTPLSSSPTRSVESLTLIDRYTAVEGTLTSSRDIRIEGEFRGTLRCEGSIQVAEGAHVDATVEANLITVAGILQGVIDCRGKFHILRSGHVSGTITTGVLVIEEGGRCEGELTMTRKSVEAPHVPARTMWKGMSELPSLLTEEQEQRQP